MFALYACGAPSDRYLALPPALDGEGALVVVIDDERGRSIAALDPMAPILETATQGEGVVHLFYFASLPVEPGALTVASVDACRVFGLGGYRRAFRADAGAFAPIEEAPVSLTDLRFDAPCPCVTFRPTEIPLLGHRIFDVGRIDDTRVLTVSRQGVELIDVAARSSRVEIDAEDLRSVHVTSGGQRYYGRNDGRLFVETSTGGLALALEPPDSSSLRYLTGPRDPPLELLMMHDSGFVRRWDGATLTEIIDDALVFETENTGSLASVAHGRAIISQSNGAGLHVWDENSEPAVVFESWDDLIRGPIKVVAWLDDIGARVSTRSGLVFASADGTAWTRVDGEGSNRVGSVGGFGRYHDGVIEARERSGIQLLPADGTYCPFQEFATTIIANTVLQMGDAVLVIGDTPLGVTPVAFLFEPVP